MSEERRSSSGSAASPVTVARSGTTINVRPTTFLTAHKLVHESGRPTITDMSVLLAQPLAWEWCQGRRSIPLRFCPQESHAEQPIAPLAGCLPAVHISMHGPWPTRCARGTLPLPH